MRLSDDVLHICSFTILGKYGSLLLDSLIPLEVRPMHHKLVVASVKLRYMILGRVARSGYLSKLFTAPNRKTLIIPGTSEGKVMVNNVSKSDIILLDG